MLYSHEQFRFLGWVDISYNFSLGTFTWVSNIWIDVCLGSECQQNIGLKSTFGPTKTQMTQWICSCVLLANAKIPSMATQGSAQGCTSNHNFRLQTYWTPKVRIVVADRGAHTMIAQTRDGIPEGHPDSPMDLECKDNAGYFGINNYSEVHCWFFIHHCQMGPKLDGSCMKYLHETYTCTPAQRISAMHLCRGVISNFRTLQKIFKMSLTLLRDFGWFN